MEKTELEQVLGTLTYSLLQLEARMKPLQEEHSKLNEQIIKTVNEITELKNDEKVPE